MHNAVPGGMAYQKARFLAFVALVLHLEAKKSCFINNFDCLTTLTAHRCLHLEICRFSVDDDDDDDDRRTDQLFHPLHMHTG